MFKRKKMLCVMLLLCIFVSSMVGCAGNETAANDSEPTKNISTKIADFVRNNPAKKETPSTETSEGSGAELTEDIDMNVVLFVNQGWDDENDTKIPDAEYPLSGKDAEMIVDLFYSHEKEVLDSPLCSVETIRFQIGEDYLGTSMDSLHVLSGIVQGELVAIHLSEDECEALRKIISPYTQNIP